MRPEKIMNRKLVRALFFHYAGRGRKRIEELFGAEKQRGPGAFLGRAFLRGALDRAMKRIGVDEELQRRFWSRPYHRQLLLNVLETVGKRGLSHPFRFESPLVIVWNYTNLCNLRCRYCYQSAGRPSPDELSFEEKIALINQMVDAHVGFVAFSGGEPVMEPRFFDVLSYASRFLHTSIASNGTLFADREYVDKIADCGARNVFVSLDGATAPSHDFIRGTGSFARTLRGIENLVANPHVSCGINMVVTRRNLHEVPRVLELARSLGVNSFSHYNFIPTGRGAEDVAYDLTASEREELMELLYDWHHRRQETGLNIVSTSPTFARVIYQRSGGRNAGVFHYTADSGNDLSGIIQYAGGCGAGRVYAAVQPNGLVSPCVFMPDVIIGDLRKNGLKHIWQSSGVCKQLCDREHFSFDCDYRTVCGGCRARAHAYGSLTGPDPGCAVYQELQVGATDPVEEAIASQDRSAVPV
ncbi:MAG: radical SAM protein [Spirochaetota bacterium]